ELAEARGRDSVDGEVDRVAEAPAAPAERVHHQPAPDDGESEEAERGEEARPPPERRASAFHASIPGRGSTRGRGRAARGGTRSRRRRRGAGRRAGRW